LLQQVSTEQSQAWAMQIIPPEQVSDLAPYQQGYNADWDVAPGGHQLIYCGGKNPGFITV